MERSGFSWGAEAWHIHSGASRPDRQTCTNNEKAPQLRSTPVATATNIAKQAVQDKIESQVKAVEAKLETLRLKADAAKKIAEVKAIADLVTKKHEIDRKLSDLKKSNESTYQQAKADIESRVAELEKSVKAIEAKFKTA
jgi:hypothetical protein